MSFCNTKMKKTSKIKGKIIYTIFLLLFMLGGEAQVQTQLNPEVVYIGDTASLQLLVTTDARQKVELPKLGDSLSKYIEILDKKYDTLQRGNNKTYVQKITLIGFSPGTYLVKSFPVKIDGKIYLSPSKKLQINIFPVDTGLQKMYPVKSILPENLTWWDRNQKYLWYMVIGAAIAMALLLIVWLFIKEMRKKKYHSSPLLPPYEEALQNLEKLDREDYIKGKKYNSFYTDLSFILRRYFSRRFEFHAQALLSADLPGYMEKKEWLTDKESKKLLLFLKDADQVKFAKKEIEENKHKYYREWVEKIINKTRPIIEDEGPDYT